VFRVPISRRLIGDVRFSPSKRFIAFHDWKVNWHPLTLVTRKGELLDATHRLRVYDLTRDKIVAEVEDERSIAYFAWDGDHVVSYAFFRKAPVLSYKRPTMEGGKLRRLGHLKGKTHSV
jgi:hypothetical protein